MPEMLNAQCSHVYRSLGTHLYSCPPPNLHSSRITPQCKIAQILLFDSMSALRRRTLLAGKLQGRAPHMRPNLKLPPFLRQKSWSKTRKMMFLGRMSPRLFLPRLAPLAAHLQPSLHPSQDGQRQDAGNPGWRRWLKPSPRLQLPGMMPRLRMGLLSCLPEAIVPQACQDLMSQPQPPQVCPWPWLQQNLTLNRCWTSLSSCCPQSVGFQFNVVP